MSTLLLVTQIFIRQWNRDNSVCDDKYFTINGDERIFFWITMLTLNIIPITTILPITMTTYIIKSNTLITSLFLRLSMTMIMLSTTMFSMDMNIAINKRVMEVRIFWKRRQIYLLRWWQHNNSNQDSLLQHNDKYPHDDSKHVHYGDGVIFSFYDNRDVSCRPTSNSIGGKFFLILTAVKNIIVPSETRSMLLKLAAQHI